MYTVLLVDDETSVIDTLKNSISWPDLGISTIYTATDGIGALHIIENNHVDLLITDIQMPKMNGLALLEQVRSTHPDIHCILLTAYEKFEYARAACRLGIENYLLKPLQIHELTNTIENALDNLYLQRNNKETLFRENILRRWLSGNISAEELGERSGMLNISIFHAAYCVVCLRQLDSSDSFTCLTKYSDGILSCIQPSYIGYCVWDNQGYCNLILCGDTIALESLSDILLSQMRHLGLTGKVIAAIGNPIFYCGELLTSYQTALDLISQEDAFHESPVRICPAAYSRSSLLPDINKDMLSPIVSKALNYIQSEYAEGISLKEFCSNYKVTSSYAGYLFKKETNVFFNNYLNLYRIEKALLLLESTTLKINDISAKIGFSSTSHFISTFKKDIGISPQKYREQITL